MRKADPLLNSAVAVICLILGSLAFIALSEHRIMLCGKSGECSPATGLGADFMGLVFLGAAVLVGAMPLKNSRFWPLYYGIPGVYLVGATVYFLAKAF